MEQCKICQGNAEEHKHFWLHHKIKIADYYEKYYGKIDLFTGQPLLFKTREQYFSSDFNSRENLKEYLKSVPPERTRQYCINLFKARKTYRNLVYSPTQVELRSVIAPPVNFINKYFNEGYLNFCENLGFKNRFLVNLEPKLTAREDLMLREIWIDTREKTPLFFNNSKLKTLNFGDYCLEDPKSAGNVYIERKNISDFIGTFGKDIERFENELTRAAENNGYIVVLVEEDLAKALRFNTLPHVSKKIKVTPEFIFHNVRNLLQKFTNCQFLFVPNRQEASRMLKKVLFSGGICKNFDLQFAYDMQYI